jgi:hypothetical protein
MLASVLKVLDTPKGYCAIHLLSAILVVRTLSRRTRMIDLILIISFFVFLFVYWFRYAVLMLLSENQAEEPKAVITKLSLMATRETLRQWGEVPLDRLHQALENEYRMLEYMLDHAAGLGLRPIEIYLLTLDYRLMRLWFRLTRNINTAHAQRALEEMARILSYIAYKMSNRSDRLSQA